MFIWIRNIFRRIFTHLMMALYNTEKTSLSQQGGLMGENIGTHQSINQGTMLDDLLHGRVTQEVQTLRWRMYKVLAASANVKVTHEQDDEGNFTYTTEVLNKVNELRKIRLDEYDDYPLEMVINNVGKSKASHEDMDGFKILDSDKTTNTLSGELNNDSNSGVTTSRVVGEISSDEFFTLISSEPKIQIGREYPPKFQLERYTKKLNIRRIDENIKLLEFYVSKYPNEYDRRTDVFINNVRKIEENPRVSSVIDFTGVTFTTYGDTGVHDNKSYKYNNLSYDKTVEFDGHYVIKMRGTVIENGLDLTEQYRMKDLDERYANKERRDENSSSSYTLQFE